MSAGSENLYRIIHKKNQLFAVENMDEGSFNLYNDMANNTLMYQNFKRERLSKSLPDTHKVFYVRSSSFDKFDFPDYPEHDDIKKSELTTDQRHWDTLTEFCDSTSLHGWSFFGGSKVENRCSVFSLFWITVIAISILSAAYVMTTNIQEFRDATVSYNLDSPTVSLNEVYFPSVVICNMNTLRRSFVYTVLADVKMRDLNVTYQELKRIIHMNFIDGDDYELSAREKIIVENMFESKTYLNLFQELYKIALERGPFEREWLNVPLVKDHALQTQGTRLKNKKDEGAFIRAYVPELASQFREQELIVRFLTHLCFSLKLNGVALNYQSGFTTDIAESCIWMTPFIKEPGDRWDLRTMVPFAKNSWPNGLEILLDAESYDYALSSSGSEGLIISVIYQLDIPIMKNIGINIQPGQTVQIAITPTLLNTTLGARRRFNPVRRQCYFEDEISLKHFPPENSYRYEMSNCLLEATLQKIESDCNCTPKFFLTTVTGYEACEGRKKKCMNDRLADMGEQRFIKDKGLSKPCLAACVDQTYRLLVTHASYPNEDAFTGTYNYCLLLKKLVSSCRGDRRPSLIKKFPALCSLIEDDSEFIMSHNCRKMFEEAGIADKLLKHEFNYSLQQEVYNYAKKNLAKVNIYIKDPYVAKYVTEEKITEIAFVGTVGGILGLFLGFSFISAVELLYIFCIRSCLKKLYVKKSRHSVQVLPVDR